MMLLPHASLIASWPEELGGETEAERVLLCKQRGGLP